MRLSKKIEISNHAMKRMKERNMPHPKGLGLTVAGRSVKKQIRKRCPKEGFKQDHIYWTHTRIEERYIYVTVQKGINHYILITCFKYKL